VASISAGEFIHALGVWITDRSHGLQFKAAFLKTTPPTTAEGIEKYLGSGMVRGVGPVLAKRIVGAFGEKTFEVIEAAPERMREVSGIGEFRAGKIVAGWAEQKAVRDIMVFLHSNGVGTSRAVRIFKTYGHDAIQVMTENPYRLARDIRGIGFRTADAIAMKLGMTREAPQRVRAGISFALQEATDEGHCGLPVEELVKLATTLLEVDEGVIRTALSAELTDGEVVADSIEEKPCVFLRGLYVAERGIAERLRALAGGSPPRPKIDVAKALPWVEKRTGKTLAEIPVSRDRKGPRIPGCRRHRGAGRRQDHPARRHPPHPSRKGSAPAARGAHRMGCQAHDRADRHRGEDHSSAARDRSEDRRLPSRRRHPPSIATSSSSTRPAWSTRLSCMRC
jgi:exodeoxyribonuclease V alpha subunit